MYEQLKEINKKPKVFEFYTAESLWNDSYRSQQMLSYHLNEDIDVASRNRVFIDNSVKWIVSKFSLYESSKICDFGCGPGLYASSFARIGAEVTDIDFSKHSIEYAKAYAKKEGLKINYINKNYLEFEKDERYDLITMIMCDFCALSPAQRKVLLRKFYSLLDENGCVLLDIYSLSGFEQREEVASYEHNQLNKFWSENDYYGFVNTFKYEKEKVVLDKYTIVEENDFKVVYNWLQYFSIEMIKSEFSEAGFIIKEIYADVSGTEYSESKSEFAVVAVKG